MTKHIFVTGGVVSSLGKGLTSASIGMLLENRGLRVRLQKLEEGVVVEGPGRHHRGLVQVRAPGFQRDQLHLRRRPP